MQIGDEAELSAAIAAAKDPLTVSGGGTRGLGREVAGVILDVSGVSGIQLYEPGALTLVAKSGTPVAEIETLLAGEGQRLAFEPYFLTDGPSTIGGVIATNASGPRRIQAGAARDFLLGVRFVDGSGQIVKNGGRVMKNVTGYDLVKLMAGSWGTLGVLSEVSLKVLPAPEMTGRVSVHGLDPQAAVACMANALGSPFEVSAAAYLPEDQTVWLRTEGFETQVTYRQSELQARLATFGETSADLEGDWAALRDARLLPAEGDLWRISVRPSDGPAVAAALPDAARWFMDWGGGLLWVRAPEGTDIRAAMGPIAGHATLLQASPETHRRLGTFQPENPALAHLTTALRAQFDPRGILNPGLMTEAA